jgi:hypothetical protein
MNKIKSRYKSTDFDLEASIDSDSIHEDSTLKKHAKNLSASVQRLSQQNNSILQRLAQR